MIKASKNKQAWLMSVVIMFFACTNSETGVNDQDLSELQERELIKVKEIEKPDIIPDVVNNFVYRMDYPEYLLMDTSRTYISIDSLAAYKKNVDDLIRSYGADHPDLPDGIRADLNHVNAYFMHYLIYKMIRDKKDEKDNRDLRSINLLIPQGRGSTYVKPEYLIELLETFPAEIQNSPAWKQKREVLNLRELKELAITEAPDATLHTSDLQQQMQLHDILQRATNKPYTLLVFTASWCAPCHRDYRRNKQKFDRLQENNTRIISYSLDTKLANWQRLIADDDYIKEAYCDLLGFESPFVQFLDIGSIPRYVLLDPELKIVSSYKSGDMKELFDFLNTE